MGNKGYTDVHCHILPGVDDGSKNEDTTRQMLKTANEQGIRRMIATSHFTSGKHNPSKETLEKALETTRKIAKEINPQMEIYIGNELFYSPGVHEELKQGHANHMMGTRYILVEFSPQDSYHTIYDALRTFTLKGDIPILAHAERYQALYKKADRYGEIVELGAYIQMNVSSLVGGVFDKDAAFCRKMFNLRRVHFLATDAHDPEYRAPRMKECVEAIQKKIDKEYLNTVLYENVDALFANKYI